MSIKVVDRYVDLLTYIIDKKVRGIEKREDFILYKNDIWSILERNNFESNEITEKIFKDTIKWFKEKNIFITEGSTSNIKYKLHPNFKFKMSKKGDTVFKQCRFIIGQLYLFSGMLDETEKLYADVISHASIFEFMPSMPKSIRNTLSSLILYKHNKKNKGSYPYNLLQILLLSKSSFNIIIENNSINATLSGVNLKEVKFNTATLALKLNNSQFELETLSDIKFIDISFKNGIYGEIDSALEYFRKLDNNIELNDKIISFLSEFKVAHEIFFQEL